MNVKEIKEEDRQVIQDERIEDKNKRGEGSEQGEAVRSEEEAAESEHLDGVEAEEEEEQELSLIISDTD